VSDEATLADDNNEIDEPPRPVMLWRTFFWKSVQVGFISLGAAALAMGGVLLAAATFAPHMADEIYIAIETAPIMASLDPIMLLVLVSSALLFAPLFETLGFPLVHWMLSTFGMRRLFMPVIAVIAFYVHGAGLMNFAQSAAFAVFAVYYDRLKLGRTMPPAYCGAVIAHAVYNALVLAVSAVFFIAFPT
jgi:hypothetical protein